MRWPWTRGRNLIEWENWACGATSLRVEKEGGGYDRRKGRGRGADYGWGEERCVTAEEKTKGKMREGVMAGGGELEKLHGRRKKGKGRPRDGN